MEQLRTRRRHGPHDRLRPASELGTGPSDNDAPDEDGSVLVIWGANMDELDVSGLTVDEIRQQIGSAYNIAPDVEVNVNGVSASGDTRLRAGDNLEFVHAAGEKGSAG
jgi:hypothetical protein